MRWIPSALIPALLMACAFPSALWAQDGGVAEAAAAGLPEGATAQDALTTHMEAGLGFGAVEEDLFFTFNFGTAFQFASWSLGVQVPLRFRVHDEAPLCVDDCVLRREDWDEFHDYLRILRYLQYGTPRDPFYLRFGEFNGVSMGHATVVDRYYNVIDINHHKLGLRTTVDFGLGGVEFLVDDIAPPSIVGLRTYIRPMKLFSADPLPVGEESDALQRIATGIFFVGDLSAPSGVLTPTSTESLESSVQAQAVFYGWDVEWEIVATKMLEVVPYLDIVGFNDLGMGTHLGTFFNVHMPMDMHLDTRLEYRFATGQYQPSYFNSLYEIERFSFPSAGGITRTKYDHFKDEDGDEDHESRHGVLGSLDYRWGTYLAVGGTYEDYPGDGNANITLRSALPYIHGFKFAAQYSKRNFDNISQMFDLDGALFVASARYMVYGPAFVSADYARQWHLVTDGNGETYYESTSAWSIGGGVELAF